MTCGCDSEEKSIAFLPLVGISFLFSWRPYMTTPIQHAEISGHHPITVNAGNYSS
jgi:hypothetical protein